MNNKRNVKQAGLLYLLGNIFNKGIVFLTVPIFTRILSTYDYGIVNTYNSWAAILNMVLGCALTMGVRSSFIDYEDEVDGFIASIVSFSLKITLLMSFIAFIICLVLNLSPINMIMVTVCFLHGGFWAIIDDYLQYLMLKHKYKERTLLMILPNLTGLTLSIIVILGVLESAEYLGRIIPIAFVHIVFGLIICVLINKSRKPREKYIEHIKYGLAISTPLVVHGIALNLLSQSDRTMITLLADASQTGIYSLIYNFSMIATVLTTSFDGIWVPFFIEKLKSRDLQEINEKIHWYIDLMTSAMCCLVLVGPEIVKFMASEAYWEGITIIPPIVISNFLIFCYTFYVNVEHFHKKTKLITIFTIIAAIVNVITNWIFIPIFGYVAASYTTLFSYLVALILHSYNAMKLESDILQHKIFMAPLVGVFCASTVFYVTIDSYITRWLIALLIFCVYIYRNKDIIQSLLRKN